MRGEELDRILSRETDIVPSSGFVSPVMNAVRSEALTPPPIPFPWKRALPGFAAWGLALVWVAIEGIRQSERGAAAPPILARLASGLAPVLETTAAVGAGWIILALLLSLAFISLSMRFTGRGA
ncbi:MAG TPA: hypothetical protein VE422_04630 [Terriglobia bacterium]|nr:hypothetical protein [Terriglobia bacterium]